MRELWQESPEQKEIQQTSRSIRVVRTKPISGNGVAGWNMHEKNSLPWGLRVKEWLRDNDCMSFFVGCSVK